MIVSDATPSQVDQIIDDALSAAHPNLFGERVTFCRLVYAVGAAAEYAQSAQFGPEHEVTLAFREYAEFLASAPYESIKDRAEAARQGIPI